MVLLSTTSQSVQQSHHDVVSTHPPAGRLAPVCGDWGQRRECAAYSQRRLPPRAALLSESACRAWCEEAHPLRNASRMGAWCCEWRTDSDADLGQCGWTDGLAVQASMACVGVECARALAMDACPLKPVAVCNVGMHLLTQLRADSLGDCSAACAREKSCNVLGFTAARTREALSSCVLVHRCMDGHDTQPNNQPSPSWYALDRATLVEPRPSSREPQRHEPQRQRDPQPHRDPRQQQQQQPQQHRDVQHQPHITPQERNDARNDTRNAGHTAARNDAARSAAHASARNDARGDTRLAAHDAARNTTRNGARDGAREDAHMAARHDAPAFARNDSHQRRETPPHELTDAQRAAERESRARAREERRTDGRAAGALDAPLDAQGGETSADEGVADVSAVDWDEDPSPAAETPAQGSDSAEPPVASWDFYGREWNQRVPQSLSPTAQDENPWCPPEFTQDGFTYFPHYAPHPQQVCRQVCLPRKYERIATQHGLILGSTCYSQGCTVFTEAKKVIAGVKVFQFSCPEGHLAPFCAPLFPNSRPADFTARMQGWDEGGIHWNDMRAPALSDPADSLNAARIKYREFIRTYRDEQRGTFIYRDQLRAHYNSGEYYLEVNLDHLLAFDEPLANALMARPGVHLPLFEDAAKEAAVQIAVTPHARMEDLVDIQVLLSASKHPSTIREMLSQQVSRLVHIPGIITHATRPKPKVTVAMAMCKKCGDKLPLINRAGLGNKALPRTCGRQPLPGEERCPIDPYTVLPEESKFIDQQQLKLQEAPEAVPTGEMPRTLKLIVDRTLVGKVTPGSRCTVTGVYTVVTSKPNDGKPANRGGAEALAIREPYLRVVGLKVGIDTDGKHSLARFTADEEESFRQLARSGDVYGRIVKSIAPSICGRDDVKAAVACLLFGGTRKRLADGMHLRGDVNVLLLGDPSVAKSQFLKFAEKVAPIGVYTSGKGSSAAGLTAMVTQEPGSRDFYLEGGAMVLADGGIVCIDEFDKMREQDRVAIHEAMEQQTISIAKAGITTILNSRAAVLAAANPAFGAYDDSQELESNLDLGATILSRFDLIFILRDLRNEELDSMIARHVVGLHTQGGAPKEAADGASDEIAIEELQRYIHYCRTRCFPRLTEGAAQVLQGHYVKFREQMRVLEDNGGGGIPITVRQLEAIVRVAEALAKMELSEFADESHVAEAIRLFTVSTIESAKSGGLTLEGHVNAEVQTCEKLIKNRVLVSHHMSQKVLVDELCKQGLTEKSIKTAIKILVQRGEFQLEKQNKYLKRLR